MMPEIIYANPTGFADFKPVCGEWGLTQREDDTKYIRADLVDRRDTRFEQLMEILTGDK